MTPGQIRQILCVGACALLGLLPGDSSASQEPDEPTAIRIGWQIPAATQGQLVEVLKRTDVLESHGLEPRLVPFSYGGPQVEAALAGDLDVFFAGDQPVINLIARGGRWRIAARLMYDRVAIMVPVDSTIREIRDLQGKTVASPFGSIAHRDAFVLQQNAGLDPEVDVDNRNVDILEIRRHVLEHGTQTWGDFDAVAVWEPIGSQFELSGMARVLGTSQAMWLVAVSDEFLSQHPDAATGFLVAVTRAWHHFANHSDTVRQWYLDDTQLDYAIKTLASAAELDPNFSAKSLGDVDLRLNEEHIATLDRNAAWGQDDGGGGSEIRTYVDQTVLDRATEQISVGDFEPLRVILPTSREGRRTQRDGHGLDTVPLLALFVFMVAVALLAIEVGLWLGKRGRTKLALESLAPFATVVAAVLSMLAFVIALTFGSASNRFDARKQALLDDVKAIQTSYLRANLLAEPHRTTVRSLLRDYVEARVGMVHSYGDPDTLQLVQRRAEALQESMWSHAESLADTGDRARVFILFASSLNDLINAHTARIVLGAHYRIPGFVWWALIFASGMAMVAVGFQFGIGTGRRILMANLALATTFALVMLLVFDLDRAGEGMVSVNQQPMLDLHQSISTQR